MNPVVKIMIDGCIMLIYLGVGGKLFQQFSLFQQGGLPLEKTIIAGAFVLVVLIGPFNEIKKNQETDQKRNVWLRIILVYILPFLVGFLMLGSIFFK